MDVARNTEVLCIERFVPHVSTVPAIQGQLVGLHLREKLTEETQRNLKVRPAPVVLFVHGGFAPSPAAYDLGYRDYSFMDVLARAGYDVFAMTHTGYGYSPRPLMDDPHNIAPEFQHLVIPHVLERPVTPRYPFRLVSSRTEWDEIATVVDFIRELRGVERISFVAWSTGVPRVGGFAALHPDKVNKLVFFGPSPYFPDDEPPSPYPQPGAPMILQSRHTMLRERWADKVVDCDDYLEDPQVPDEFWRALMALDPLGAQWGPNGEGIMRAPERMNYGWRANVGRIQAPTLVLLGEFDDYHRRLDTWYGLRVAKRVFIKVLGATHFMQFERARRVLYQATLEWLAEGTVDGRDFAQLVADREGRLAPLPNVGG